MVGRDLCISLSWEKLRVFVYSLFHLGTRLAKAIVPACPYNPNNSNTTGTPAQACQATTARSGLGLSSIFSPKFWAGLRSPGIGHPRRHRYHAAHGLRALLRRQRYARVLPTLPLAAIGSSDHHGVGPLGICRTYVFSHDDSDRSILEAIHQRHSVVYDGDGPVRGDSELIRLAADRLRNREPKPSGILDLLSRDCSLLGLIGFLISSNRAVYSAKKSAISFPAPLPKRPLLHP
jgi:hypothetical protein